MWAVIGVLLVAGCGGTPGADTPTSTSPPTTSSAPATTETRTTLLDGETAERLVGFVVATGSFLGLPEFPLPHSEPNAGDELCATADGPEPLVEQTHAFSTPSTDFAQLVEVHQRTAVYRTAEEARQMVTQTFDGLESCVRQVRAGQVTEGWARAPAPGEVLVESRVVTATMTVLATGGVFPHRYGCLVRGPVVQCIRVWTTSEPNTAVWFDQALIATAATLTQQVPG